MIPHRLTWEGHEFLDAARDQGLWDRVKAAGSDHAVGMSFELMKVFLIELPKNTLFGGSAE